RAAQQAIDAEPGAHLGRAQAAVAAGAHHLHIAGPAVLPDAVAQALQGIGRNPDVLEADVPERHVAHGVVNLEAILDGLVVARQHEDEIHDPRTLAALPYFEALCAKKWGRRNHPQFTGSGNSGLQTQRKTAKA